MKHPSDLNYLERKNAECATTGLPVERVSYSVPEVAKAADTCPAIIYREINSGRLVALKLGKRTLITPEAIKNWLASLEKYPVKKDMGE